MVLETIVNVSLWVDEIYIKDHLIVTLKSQIDFQALDFADASYSRSHCPLKSGVVPHIDTHIHVYLVLRLVNWLMISRFPT